MLLSQLFDMDGNLNVLLPIQKYNVWPYIQYTHILHVNDILYIIMIHVCSWHMFESCHFCNRLTIVSSFRSVSIQIYTVYRPTLQHEYLQEIYRTCMHAWIYMLCNLHAPKHILVTMSKKLTGPRKLQMKPASELSQQLCKHKQTNINTKPKTSHIWRHRFTSLYELKLKLYT